jgi:hypothetical protein
MSIYLTVLLGTGFLVLWFTTYRMMRRDGDADGLTGALLSFKRLLIALLIFIALFAMLFLVGAAVWFGLRFFFPGLSNEWRVELAVAAAMVVWAMLFIVPFKRLSKGEKV